MESISANNVDRSGGRGCLGCAMVFLVGLTIIGLLGVGSLWVRDLCNSHSITEKTYIEKGYGSEWPLTVSEGRVIRREDPDRTVLLFEDVTGKKYALNGTAMVLGFENIHQITKVEKTYDDGSVYYMDVSGLEKVCPPGR